MRKKQVKRHWLKLAARMLKLSFSQPEKTSELVCQSYNKVSETYDETWTNHMHDKSLEMIDKLAPENGEKSLDLMCGTGFVTNILAERTNAQVIGVDASEGMINVARSSCDDNCRFVNSDVVSFMKKQPSNNFDVITSGWGLGYSKPFRVLREAKRILRPQGRIAVIDNTLFTIREAIWSAVLTVAEQPDSLKHMMKVSFLAGRKTLVAYMMFAGLNVVDSWQGSKIYWAKTGRDALERLRETGAFAGFEFATRQEDEQMIADIFCRTFEEKYKTKKGIPINHRYTGAIGKKRS